MGSPSILGSYFPRDHYHRPVLHVLLSESRSIYVRFDQWGLGSRKMGRIQPVFIVPVMAKKKAAKKTTRVPSARFAATNQVVFNDPYWLNCCVSLD